MSPSFPPDLPGLSEWRLPVAGGHLAGVDNASNGPNILFVHSAGFSSMTWARVIEHLPDMRCVAVDLRGHGHSEAPLLDAENAWRDIPYIVQALGLTDPVLVGHDTGAFAVMCAAADRPGLARAVVAIDADLPFTERVQLQADFDWAQTPEVTQLIRERFRFGEVLHTEAEFEELVHALTEQCVDDWLLEGVDSAIEAEVRRSMLPRPDGTWLHGPAVEAAVIGYRIDIDAEYYPTADLYERIGDPLHMVRYLRSPNAQPPVPYLELARRLGTMRVHDIDGGHLAHYSHADELASIIRGAVRGEARSIQRSAHPARRRAG